MIKRMIMQKTNPMALLVHIGWNILLATFTFVWHSRTLYRIMIHAISPC